MPLAAATQRRLLDLFGAFLARSDKAWALSKTVSDKVSDGLRCADNTDSPSVAPNFWDDKSFDTLFPPREGLAPLTFRKSSQLRD